MKFTIKTTLESVSFAGAKLRDEDLGGLAIECKTESGRSMRDLAPFFGKQGAVRITFEGDSPQESGASWKDTRDERLCTCPAVNEYDPPCPLHGVLGIGVTGQATAPAPPVANGRPSCCVFCPFCGAKLPEVPR